MDFKLNDHYVHFLLRFHQQTRYLGQVMVQGLEKGKAQGLGLGLGLGLGRCLV